MGCISLAREGSLRADGQLYAQDRFRLPIKSLHRGGVERQESIAAQLDRLMPRYSYEVTTMGTF